MKKFNPNNLESKFLITRHTIKKTEEEPLIEKYPGITEKGLELAKERTKDFAQEILESPPGTIIFMGAISKLPRTKSTMKIYNETLNNELVNEENIEFFDRERLTKNGKLGPTEMMKNLTSFTKQNPDKKIIINVPLFIKFDVERRKSQYFIDLIEKAKGREEVFMNTWLKDTEKGELKDYPSPNDVSVTFLKELIKVETFIKRYFPNRKVIIGTVGHASAMTALAGYFLGKGKSTKNVYEKEIGYPIKETEMLILSRENDQWTTKFRDKITEIKHLPNYEKR